MGLFNTAPKIQSEETNRLLSNEETKKLLLQAIRDERCQRPLENMKQHRVKLKRVGSAKSDNGREH